jgi:hypothetical protein
MKKYVLDSLMAAALVIFTYQNHGFHDDLLYFFLTKDVYFP